MPEYRILTYYCEKSELPKLENTCYYVPLHYHNDGRGTVSDIVPMLEIAEKLIEEQHKDVLRLDENAYNFGSPGYPAMKRKYGEHYDELTSDPESWDIGFQIDTFRTSLQKITQRQPDTNFAVLIEPAMMNDYSYLADEFVKIAKDFAMPIVVLIEAKYVDEAEGILVHPKEDGPCME